MKINKLIEKLTLLKDKVGGDEDIVFVSLDGENDIFEAEYPVAGDFEDCDGNDYKCAFIISKSGEEFTRKNVPHYKWDSYIDKVGE